MAANPTDTMNALLECVTTALAEAERPVCSSGLTIGPPVIGPAQCCECDDTPGGQVSAYLERLYPADGQTLNEEPRLENCRPGAVAADVTIVVTRCYPRINEQGFMPTLDETTGPSEDLNTDMVSVWQALRCCEGQKLVIRESAVDSDPEGGCSAFALRLSVQVSL